MKFLIALLLSVYVILSTLSAPVLHYGKSIQAHDLSNRVAMGMQGANSMASKANDMVARCIEAASFFSTAIVSHLLLIVKILSAVLALLLIVVLFFGKKRNHLFARWRFAIPGYDYSWAVLYVALHLFRKWFVLLKHGPYYVAAVSV